MLAQKTWHLSSTAEQVISIGTENPVHLQHVFSTPKPATPTTTEQLTGSMGELLKVLIEDFRTGKKAWNDLALHPEDGCLRLKWPQAFAGYGFTPNRYWMALLSAAGWKQTVMLPK